MNAPVSQTDTYTDFQGLASLRARTKDNDPDTLREVAGQFEALFLQMMLKSMRDASLGDGIFDSDQSKTYQSLFDRQIAMDLSQKNSIGLADIIVRQLSQQPVSGNQPIIDLDDQKARPLQFDPHDRVRAIVPLNANRVADWSVSSPADFVRTLLPEARAAADDLGVAPEVLIAQAALETGWGQSMIKGVDGRNSFNLFGIKADSSWQGPKVFSDTVEFRDGVMRRERAAFRAYESPAESFGDYVRFLRANPRYKEALQSVRDNQDYTAALSRAGYATDPDYASKINKIVTGEVVAAIKNEGV